MRHRMPHRRERNLSQMGKLTIRPQLCDVATGAGVKSALLAGLSG
jgi:hypothetical protein